MANLPQPFGKMACSVRVGALLQCYAAHDLAERDDAEMHLARLDGPQPPHRLRRATAGFRNDIRQQTPPDLIRGKCQDPNPVKRGNLSSVAYELKLTRETLLLEVNEAEARCGNAVDVPCGAAGAAFKRQRPPACPRLVACRTCAASQRADLLISPGLAAQDQQSCYHNQDYARD